MATGLKAIENLAGIERRLAGNAGQLEV